MVNDTLTISGHLLDENTLAKVLTTLDTHGVRFEVRRFRVGQNATSPSFVDLRLSAADWETLKRALDACAPLGVTAPFEDAALATAESDGVFPEGFYSTTNLTTTVQIDGRRINVEKLEMDVGIRVTREAGGVRAEGCAMHRVKKGDAFVVGFTGVRVEPAPADASQTDEFRFMSSEVSSERPKARMIEHVAEVIRGAKGAGQRVLFVGGPAVIHSGSGPYVERLIAAGFIDVLFAGNALAAHDVESAIFGTSLGVELATGAPAVHGHSNHLRAINRVRRAGSLAAAVRQGIVQRGVMHACVTKPIPFVLGGSIRDDGPLPDVYANVVEAQDAMRANIEGVGVAIMVATTLHSVATGNILPAHVRTYCVDNDADTVIKLTDRGTHQAVGLVTDCEFFLQSLARALVS